MRSSWLMLARNCDLCWLAISSCRLFSSISLEQARVLDRQHRLGGERLQQVDRVLRERAGRLRRRTTSAPTTSSRASERHDEQRAEAGAQRDVVELGVVGICLDVGDLHRLVLASTAQPIVGSPMPMCRCVSASISSSSMP